MTVERGELYRHVPPPADPILVGDLTFSVDDEISEDEEISWAVRSICQNRSGGPSGMRAEHLRQWLIAATRDNSPDATNCLKVFTIVQAAFRDGILAEDFMWKTVVLLTKGKGGFRGIGLVEVLWKAVASLLNRQFTAAICSTGFGRDWGRGSPPSRPSFSNRLRP